MLIDATHPEETRVVVVDGKRLEEFDFETASRKLLKGNIYLAKVTRVEPSLQAAFVEYGGNRHGFLSFNEIHPDYYRIPVADREALLAEQAAMARADEAPAMEERTGPSKTPNEPEPPAATIETLEGAVPPGLDEPLEPDDRTQAAAAPTALRHGPLFDEPEPDAEGEFIETPAQDSTDADDGNGERAFDDASTPREPADDDARNQDDGGPSEPGGAGTHLVGETDNVEVVGGDEMEEVRTKRQLPSRRYKIQEVIKRRQIMLIQVTKEERGTKGAALTTFLSLAGRYCVLMPNTARGGGVSRKITNPADRKRLKQIIEEMNLPEGMAVIVRTAGSERSKVELKRDCEYLVRLWDEIRELTLKSTAPALIYEEANLIKRSIRDLYSRDLEDVIVEGEEGYKSAKAFMRALMPSHAKRVQQYKDATTPLFNQYQIESQLDAIHSPTVNLRSGGYIVLNSTEALVAIDVNSGRATRERDIEETALKTNMEAAEEVARQLRLRDLAGLIVIDFIDMEEQRHNIQVERRLKEAMRHDRARIQLGRISPFGLLELSRQRLRPSLFESSMTVCAHCRGTGHVRSTESMALHVLRSVQDEGLRQRAGGVTVTVPTNVALYLANQKRQALADIDARHGMRVQLAVDDGLIPPEFRMERQKIAPTPVETRAPVVRAQIEEAPDTVEAEIEVESEREAPESVLEVQPVQNGDDAPGRRRRRRRRRRRDEVRPRQPGQREPTARVATAHEQPEAQATAVEAPSGEGAPAVEDAAAPRMNDDGQRRRRRRGRRGGRRRGQSDRDTASPSGNVAADSNEPQPEGPMVREESVEAAHEPSRNESSRAVESFEAGRREKPSEAVMSHRTTTPQEPGPSAGEAGASEEQGEPRRGWWRRLRE
jgi:ribonuclease E